MLFSTGLRWNRPRQWPRETSSTTMCSDPSVRGSHQRKRGALRKILRMAMSVSKRRSINGLPQRNIERISCSPKRPVSASPAHKAPLLIAPIGPWRSRATMNRRRSLQARKRRRQPTGKRPLNPAGSNSSASAFEQPSRRSPSCGRRRTASYRRGTPGDGHDIVTYRTPWPLYYFLSGEYCFPGSAGRRTRWRLRCGSLR